MKCWTCEKYTDMCDAEFNGCNPMYGKGSEWSHCDAWNMPIDQLMEMDHDFRTCEHYTPDQDALKQQYDHYCREQIKAYERGEDISIYGFGAWLQMEGVV